MLVLKRKVFVSGTKTSKKEMGEIMRIVTSLKKSGTFLKDITEPTKNETKE